MRERARIVAVVVVLAGLLLSVAAASAQMTKLATESYFVPARDPGIQLYVRNKRPDGVTRFGPDKIVLFVHGATYPARRHSTWRSTACRGWTTSPSAGTTSI
jgi:hypothetical protein